MPLQINTTHHITYLTLNRPEKSNAFDEHLIQALTHAINVAIQDEQVKVIVLKANGKHFSAGADLEWMQRMAHASLEDNRQDAEKLALLLHTLYHCPKPTLAQIQGATYGGGIGLIAACDIAVAETDATFCFSEVKLGLIPATISPFVIQAIGSKAAKWLFLSADIINASQAQALQLIQCCVPKDELEKVIETYANKLVKLPAEALKACKSLVYKVQDCVVDTTLLKLTAELIAKQRQTPEAKKLIQAFLKSAL